MNIKSTANLNLMERLVCRLYPDHDARNICQQIIGLWSPVDDRTEVRAGRSKDLWSEQDQILIAYGDHVRAPDSQEIRALAALNQFLIHTKMQEAFSAVHILPFFPYTSDDGFSVSDYYEVNPDLGDWSHIAKLAKSFDLMFDFVVNHMSAKSVWFHEFLQEVDEQEVDKQELDKQEISDSNLFLVPSSEFDASKVVRPRSLPLITEFKTPKGKTVPVWTTFSADQVDFDFRSPQTLIKLLEVLRFYLRQGAKQIRLDAVGFLWKQSGTSCIHLQQTHDAIKLMRLLVDSYYPGTWLITETNVPHTENISYFGDGDEAHLVYQFTLPPLMLYSLLQEDASVFINWLSKISTSHSKCTFFNFTASHDGIGLRPLEGIIPDSSILELARSIEDRGGCVSYRRKGDVDLPYEINATYRSALDSDKKFLCSQAIALALPGVPGIYFSSLFGAENDMDGLKIKGYPRAINRRKYSLKELWSGPGGDSGEESGNTLVKSEIFATMFSMLSLRRKQPAFHPNAGFKVMQNVSDKYSGLVVFERHSSDSSRPQRIVVVANLTGKTIPLEIKDLVMVEGRDLIACEPLAPQFSVGGFQVRWIIG